MSIGDWYAVLIGPMNELKRLSELGDGHRHSIIEIDPSKDPNLTDKDKYVLTSELLNQMSSEDYDKAKNIATSLVNSISGSSALYFGTRQRVYSESMVHYSDGCMTFVSEPESWLQPATRRVSQDQISNVLSISENDESVARVLRLNGSGEHNWVNWYRIYEVIKADVGGEDNMCFGSITSSTLVLFRRTANSVSATGDLARHAEESTQPPPNPMSEAAANQFIRELIDGWILSKG